MSTNARIGILHKDKSTDTIYCHWDGYPSYITPILLRSYNNIHKITQLINLGDISVLHDNITPPDKTKPHTFDHPQDNTVIAYHRDRKEPWQDTQPMHTNTKQQLVIKTDVPYIYLFNEATNQWTYTHGTRFRGFFNPVTDPK